MTMNLGGYNPQISTYSRRFQVQVAWVDHNSTINDEQQEGVLESTSPQTGRNLHVGGFKLSADSPGIITNILVPQDVIGSFKVPQVGDIIWVDESRRRNDQTPLYMFSTYAQSKNPVPLWGSMPGDYGNLRTHTDHSRQFLTTTGGADFRTKYMRSITGERFRSFYRSNLEPGRFVVRGDAVFDIDKGDLSREYLINSGSALIEGAGVDEDKGVYPEPLNVPKEREKDEAYSYVNVIYQPIPIRLSNDHYDLVPKSSKTPTKIVKNVLKTKNYMAYQPVMDKKYLDKSNFERELPAAEEYQLALRGNNKLLIQDQYGDGEQLIITLKSQYDEQFTIVHNGDRGQVRVRDHLGQGVLLDADPEAPRVISWTANKQVIEQGGVKDVGEFTYIRNGSAFGDSHTSFGTKTGVTKNDVPNQEILMVSTPDIIGELGSRLSSGMFNLAGGGDPGIYFRNNTDPDAKNQSFSLTSNGTNLSVSMSQSITGLDGVQETSTFSQTLNGSSSTQTTFLEHVTPGTHHSHTSTVEASAGNTEYSHSYLNNATGHEVRKFGTSDPPSDTTTIFLAGAPLHSIIQDELGVEIKREADGLSLPITIADDGGTGTVTIGSTSGATIIQGATVDVTNA